MIKSELIEMLICPESRMPLVLADPSLLERVNALIRQKKLANRSGQVVEGTIEAALVRQDRQLLFAIVDGIPNMLLDDAIGLEQLQDSVPSARG